MRLKPFGINHLLILVSTYISLLFLSFFDFNFLSTRGIESKVLNQSIGKKLLAIRNGFILKVKPLTQLAVDDFPVLEATGGSGALFAATVDSRPEYQGEVKQVIDCVS